ncbi:MAG TPA: hypothetical protein VFH80_02170 [Solirubrobacteraceae bacterium]|nr:hypothetical protein [Solirubrobacteraceae bacterium]
MKALERPRAVERPPSGKTTLIYADYAPAANEAALVNAAFATDLSINLRETGATQTKKALEITIDRQLENSWK